MLALKKCHLQLASITARLAAESATMGEEQRRELETSRADIIELLELMESEEVGDVI